MQYEYSGYLKTLIKAPDPQQRDHLDHVHFSADDIARWHMKDDPREREWIGIPVETHRSEEGVILRGNFNDVRRLDNIRDHAPTFWVPLSSRDVNDGRFPIDTQRFPIVEITYRSPSPKAKPAWCLEYPGGCHMDGLTPSKNWRTIARLVPHYGFPKSITGVSIRLYVSTRDTEEMEIQSIRFRAMSHTEREASEKHHQLLLDTCKVPHYKNLNDFLPFGVTMNARIAKNMADALGVSLRDYWRLSFEDIARHSHNAVALYNVELLSPAEFRDVLGMAEFFDLRILAALDWNLDNFEKEKQTLIENQIKPFNSSTSLLGWLVHINPSDHVFNNLIKAQKSIQEAAPENPFVYMTRSPNSFPLMAPFFPVSAIGYFKSNAAWDLGPMVRTHLPLCGGQQLWIVAPTHVFASNTPAWNTCPEIRLLLNNAFANGARGWFGHTYHNNPIWLNGSYQSSLTGPFLTFSDLWAELGHRIERFNGLAPLFLRGKPVDHVDINVEATWDRHTRSKLPPEIPTIQYTWLQGENYFLFYIHNNDIHEVTSVNLRFPANLPGNMQVYDVTEFVRTRKWAPTRRERHLEMLPGQGQMFLLADADASAEMRDSMALRTLENDKRLISMDLALARRYNLDIEETLQLMRALGFQKPMEELIHMLEVRNKLLNTIYDEPNIIEPRSKLIQASAAICGCDTLLSELMSNSKVDLAYEMGHRLLPLANTMTKLRFQLRKGHGSSIIQRCDRLVQDSHALLQNIQKLSRH